MDSAWFLNPFWVWRRLSVTEVLLVLVILLGSYWIIDRIRHFSLWRRYGIPGPQPSLIFGNLLQIRTKDKDILAVQTEWLEKYGDVCGYYTGHRPTLLVADLEMLRHMLIKDFPSFANRARYYLAKKPYSDMIIDKRDHHWKFLRRVTNQVFSRSRLKTMLGLMQENVDDFLAVVSEHADNNQDFDVFSVSQRLTLDVIGRCALAMKLNCLKDPKEPLLLLVRRFFKFAISPLVVVAMVFPGLAPYLRFFRSTTDAALVERAVITNLRDVLARRRATPFHGSMDFLQLLIDASDDKGAVDHSALEMTDQSPSKDDEGEHTRHSLPEEVTASDDDDEEVSLKGKKTTKSFLESNRKADSVRDEADDRPKLTDDEIVSNSYMFVLAGYETTANAIAFTCYALAKHQDWQDRCYLEVRDVVGNKAQLSYDNIGRLFVLDRVLQESLRLYPPVPCFVSREVGVTREVGGLTIPQGVNFTVPVWHIHHHPQHWPQPYLFDPDRFLPERKREHHPLSYLPFGAGPRNCIGLRFARLEIKLVIALLLKDYVIQLAPSVKDPLPVGVRTVTLSPTEGVWLQVKRRTSKSDSPDG